MADAIYYLAQHDGGHETVDMHAPAHGETHAEVGAPGGGHGEEHGGGPIKQEPNLSVYTGIAFFIVLFGLYRLTPRLLAMLDERAEKIAGDIQAAENARGDAETLQAKYEQQLADAHAEARKIIDEARQQAEAQARDILAKAQGEASALKQKAQEEVEADKVRAVKDLRGQIADLSCSVASRLINQELSADAHRALIDAAIEELTSDGSRN